MRLQYYENTIFISISLETIDFTSFTSLCVVLSICVDLLFCRSIVLSFYRSVVLSFCCSVGPQKQPSPSAYAGLSPSRRKKKTKHIIAYEETPNGRDGKLAQAFSQNR
jgi:hypothetical protein